MPAFINDFRNEHVGALGDEGPGTPTIDEQTFAQIGGMQPHQLDQLQAVSQQGAAVLRAAADLRDPISRRAFLQEHSDALAALNIPAEAVHGYDVANPRKMRADAGAIDQLGFLAGRVAAVRSGGR